MPRREQLVEARDKLRRQIELARISSAPKDGRFGVASDTAHQVAQNEIIELSVILSEIEAELADEAIDKDTK